MYKTIWIITDESDAGKSQTELTVYHFGKATKFPRWHMVENHAYTIEMAWNFKLLFRPSTFFKCLTHYHITK